MFTPRSVGEPRLPCRLGVAALDIRERAAHDRRPVWISPDAHGRWRAEFYPTAASSATCSSCPAAVAVAIPAIPELLLANLPGALSQRLQHTSRRLRKQCQQQRSWTGDAPALPLDRLRLAPASGASVTSGERPQPRAASEPPVMTRGGQDCGGASLPAPPPNSSVRPLARADGSGRLEPRDLAAACRLRGASGELPCRSTDPLRDSPHLSRHQRAAERRQCCRGHRAAGDHQLPVGEYAAPIRGCLPHVLAAHPLGTDSCKMWRSRLPPPQ